MDLLVHNCKMQAGNPLCEDRLTRIAWLIRITGSHIVVEPARICNCPVHAHVKLTQENGLDVLMSSLPKNMISMLACVDKKTSKFVVPPSRSQMYEWRKNANMRRVFVTA